MLHEFIVANRDLIIERARQRVRKRMPQDSPEAKLEHGIPMFLTQLADALVQITASKALRMVGVEGSAKRINDTGALHGEELLRHGFTVAQVVHGYGDVCQIVTELASETNAAIAPEDFHVFNRCLDDAIAGAVTAYGRHRESDLAYEGTERRGVLAHELRNLLHGATLSLDVIKRGTVGMGGSTGAMLVRCLAGLSSLIEGSLAEVRLEAGNATLRPVVLAEFIEEVEVEAALQAEASGCSLFVGPIDRNLVIAVDRQLLASAVSNLLQNAFKFTRGGGSVSVLARAVGDRVLIDVCDACGGLPPGRAQELFRPFSQLSTDHTGLGLGLTIALRAVRANSGNLSVRDIPGTGCVFTIDLPRSPAPATPIFHVLPHGDRGTPGSTANGAQTGG